jgi:hypothetical protein
MSEKIVSTGEWVWSMILIGIPVVGFIMLLVWSFSGGTNINKKNFARAALVIYVVVFIISLITSAIGGFSLFSYMNYY